MNSGNVLLGVIVGAATGAAIGILFAPEKGADTRKIISKKGADYLHNLTSKVEDIPSTANREWDYAKREGEDWLDKGKEKAQEVKNEIKNKANEKFSTPS